MRLDWKRFFPDIRSLDPDDARRRKLLNILLAGAAGITVLVLAASTALLLTGAKWADLWMVFAASLAFLLYAGAVFALNQRGPGWLASLLFLLLLVASFTFGDIPAEVVAGRTLILFTAPIIMASVLLRPWASFALAGVCGAAITALAVAVAPAVLSTVPASIGLFLLLALVSWLAARSLEKALSDLRTLNRELDLRVQQRTMELTTSNARLAESLSENTAILNSIADGVIVLDQRGQAVVANPSMEVYLGRSVKEILQQDMATLVRTGVEATQSEALLNLLNQAGTAHPNIRLQWGSRTLSVSLAPVQADGRHAGTVAVFRDFTKEAEVERLKSMFVSMITHELRSPLGATSSFVDMLLSSVWGELANDQQRDVLKRIRSNTKQLLSLIGDLLDRARLEAGKLALNPVRFSPATLVEEVQAMLSGLAETKHLEFGISLAPEVPAELMGDPQRLTQILVNLVGNAIKFTEKGSVRGRVFRSDDTHWALEVADTGCGIPLTAQAHIFDPFRQVDGTITRKYGGTGLGLAIVKDLVKLMEGEITVASEVGQGSTFLVTLPLRLAD